MLPKNKEILDEALGIKRLSHQLDALVCSKTHVKPLMLKLKKLWDTRFSAYNI